MAAASGLTARIRSRLARLDGRGREPGVDLARGLAVFGMFAAHLLTTVPFDWAHPDTWTDLVNGRSSILFATLAGVSLALVTGRTDPLSGTALAWARARISLRAVCIWVIGYLLILLNTPVLVILPAYAILFLFALPLLRIPAAWLFAVAALIAVTMPFAVHAIDAVLRTGVGWRRYPNDSYGEHADGAAWDGDGIGRSWPLLVGERGHYELARGNVEMAELLCGTMARLAGPTGMLPEQTWDAPDVPARGLWFGQPTHSAAPLGWAHAEYMKLCRSLAEGRVFDLPRISPPRARRPRAAASPPW